MRSVTGMSGRLEAWLPYIQRAPRVPKTLPPWMDPHPAGDPTYDPFGTSMPFRPTHRPPGTEKSTRRKSSSTQRPAISFDSPLSRLASALQHNFTWRFAGKNPLQSIQPTMLPFLAFAGSVLLLAFGATFLYSHFLPKNESQSITPASVDQTYASSNDDQSTTLDSPNNADVGSGDVPPDPEPGPLLINPSTGDEFRSPVNKEMLLSPIVGKHYGNPAADLLLPIGTPVYAVHAGTVNLVDTTECGSGIVIHGTDGNRYTYCFASELIVSNRAEVKAGDFIMRSGTPPTPPPAITQVSLTDVPKAPTEDTAPHLHFEITVGSQNVCPQEVLKEWFNNEYADPSKASKTACLMNP